MENISVNILSSSTGMINDSNSNSNLNSNNIDVESLSNLKNSKEIFDINMIISIKKQKREKLLETYITYYDRCIEKIKILNKRNICDLFFQVPFYIPDCFEYKPQDCIDFIQNKLKKYYMDSYKINNNTIFITWKYIELNSIKN